MLRRKLIFTARCFPDYNFRSYFVRHIKEDFATSSEEVQKKLIDAGPQRLAQLRRMVIVNKMYSTQPVIVDSRRSTCGLPK